MLVEIALCLTVLLGKDEIFEEDLMLLVLILLTGIEIVPVDGAGLDCETGLIETMFEMVGREVFAVTVFEEGLIDIPGELLPKE